MKLIVVCLIFVLTGSAKAGMWVNPEILYPNMCERSICDSQMNSWVVSCDAGKSLSEALMRQPGQNYAYPLQGCYCPCPIFNWNAFFEESLNW